MSHPRTPPAPVSPPRKRRPASLSDPVLTLVSRHPVSVPVDVTLRELARTMADENVDAVLVRDARGIVGLVCDWDVAEAVGGGADPDRSRAWDVMTPDPATIDAGASVLDAAERMLERGVHHLLVTSPKATVGLVSAGEVLATLADTAIEP